ncbi:hypothetical protein ACTWJ8_39975 (plasmid) [Streptomyces sp. SDT5-1]|uniref:hypothetical protein n=1 Tax=Streptomyces sp. SDT5-1 TaxID=3406418 RepID=UPI003FD64673
MTDALLSQPGYWAECRLNTSTSDEDVLVGAIDVPTANQALRWTRVLVRMLQSLLTEAEAEPVDLWLYSGQGRARAQLREQRPIELLLKPGRFPGIQLRITVTPVVFLRLADRDPHNLPACSQRWTQPASVAGALAAHTRPAPEAAEQR